MTRHGFQATHYTLRRVQEMLGLSRTVLTGLISAGFVVPTRGPRNEHRFSFQDLMLLRTALGLQRAGIKPRKILQALARLQAELPAESPLTGLRISAVGGAVAVRDRHGQRQSETGQWLMEFESQPAGGSVASLSTSPVRTSDGQTSPVRSRPSAADWFRRAEALEASDAEQAELFYRRALALEPSDIRAYLNLGALLCETDRFGEASALYRTALLEYGPHPLLHFNHGVAQEGDADPAAALVSYRLALELDAALADAHYNAGMLLESQGDARGALRHFSAYRRLLAAGQT